MKQLVLEILPPPAPNFANFVAGKNVEAVDALVNAASNTDRQTTKVLYVWGVSGSGKSHLLGAFAAAAGARPAPQAAAIEIIGIAQSDATHVMVDDVERLDDEAQVALFDAINQRALDPQAMVIVAGNVAPRDLPLRPELSSRLGSGLVFALHPLGDGEKLAALKAHAASRGFNLREEVVAYLLRHSRRDMASLVTFLNALDRYSFETGREITLPLLKEMVQPELEHWENR